MKSYFSYLLERLNNMIEKELPEMFYYDFRELLIKYIFPLSEDLLHETWLTVEKLVESKGIIWGIRWPPGSLK